MSLEANPTGVSSTTGLSDTHRAAAVAQSLWDQGAWDAPAEPGQEPQAPQQQPRRQEAQPQARAEPQQQVQQPQAPEAEPEGQVESEGPEYQDLADFLTKSQIDPASFHQMPVEIVVDGQKSKVPLSDLLKSYQQEEHFSRKSQRLSEAQRQFETERTQAIAAYQQTLKQAEQLSTIAHQIAFQDFQGIDWNKLAAENPQQWTQLNALFQQRRQMVEQHLGQMNQQAQAAEQQRLMDLQQKTIPAEREKLLSLRPEWRDEKQFSTAQTQMRSAAKQLGFTDAELGQVYDHRYLLALDLASRFLALQAQAPQAVKRVRTAPLVAQPGARQQRDPNTVARQQAKEQFFKNRRSEDAQARYAETLL